MEIWKFKTGLGKQNQNFGKSDDFKNLELLTQTSDCLQIFFVAPEIYSSLWENCLEVIKCPNFFVIEKLCQVGTVSPEGVARTYPQSETCSSFNRSPGALCIPFGISIHKSFPGSEKSKGQRKTHEIN